MINVIMTYLNNSMVQDMEPCKNISKPQYRSKIGIISEILGVTMDAGRDGAIISSISRRTNLSHHTLIENCQKLIDAGMAKSTNNKQSYFCCYRKGNTIFSRITKISRNCGVNKSKILNLFRMFASL